MRRLGLVMVVALSLVGLVACGEETDAVGQRAAGVQLATADVGGYGKIVVDGNGRTVYVFDKDTAGKSNCDGECAAKWPPVAAGEGTPKLDGIEASLVGTATRSDGSKQLTLNGLPLYLYADDTKKGEAKGQAVGGVWWIVGADGKKITTQPSSGDDGYGY